MMSTALQRRRRQRRRLPFLEVVIVGAFVLTGLLALANIALWLAHVVSG